MAFVEPLGVFLADFGAPVTFAGAPDGALGLMDFEDREILADEGRAAVVGRFRTLLVLTSVADLLTIGATLTADGIDYVVRQKDAVNDGTYTLLTLR